MHNNELFFCLLIHQNGCWCFLEQGVHFQSTINIIQGVQKEDKHRKVGWVRLSAGPKEKHELNCAEKEHWGEVIKLPSTGMLFNGHEFGPAVEIIQSPVTPSKDPPQARESHPTPPRHIKFNRSAYSSAPHAHMNIYTHTVSSKLLAPLHKYTPKML